MILWFYKFLILKLQILRRTHVKVTVTGLMGEGGGSGHDQAETDDRALYHGLSLNLAAKRLSCISSIAVLLSISSTGLATCGS